MIQQKRNNFNSEFDLVQLQQLKEYILLNKHLTIVQFLGYFHLALMLFDFIHQLIASKDIEVVMNAIFMHFKLL
ncbi:unnamed protein product [Paramecium octaurelia]|uniref:Transmembrane protein n=1 Tax=Paramecium octaurelia TaxID=43137 RepID=A0A8S1WV94_PAROT|nr:unnamed protein product [Paramecium octaurelia]